MAFLLLEAIPLFPQAIRKVSFLRLPHAKMQANHPDGSMKCIHQ